MIFLVLFFTMIADRVIGIKIQESLSKRILGNNSPDGKHQISE